MKNHSFITNFGIILSKIIGIIYVIPLYSIIGEQGGALCGYAYSIYLIFISIFETSISVAISKIIDEYNILGYYNAKRRTFLLGKKLLYIFSIILFLIIFIFAKMIATLIIGNMVSGNTLETITFIIRIISLSVLIIPFLSIYRGYLQGHKLNSSIFISQILEQLVKLLIIVLGSFLTLKVFNLSLTTTIGVVVFSVTISALVSYLYLVIKIKKDKKNLEKETLKIIEPKITNKEIIKKIIIYTLPLIMINLFKTLINTIDTFMLVKFLANEIGSTTIEVESIIGIFSFWGQKLNMIITIITTGLIIWLISNLITEDIKKDINNIKKKINQILQYLLFFLIPITIILSVLAKPVWTTIYGVSEFGPNIYQYYVFITLAMTVSNIIIIILQLLKEYKQIFICLLIAFLTKILLNLPLLYAFSYMGFPTYYGSITATILSYIVCIFLALRYINKKYQVSYEETIKRVFNIIITTLVMIIVLLILKYIIPFNSNSRIFNLIYVTLFSIVGATIYYGIMIKTKLIYNIFKKED